MRYLTFLLLLMFFFISLFVFSLPEGVYGHSGGSSHTHPHPPVQNCMICGKPGVPGQHFCAKSEREKQETQVQISNLKAELEVPTFI